MNNLIILDCEQGSEQWHKARLGIPTASQFKRIITTAGKPSSSVTDYLAELITETITGEPKSIPTNEHIERGNDLEPVARDAYEFETDSKVIEVGGVFLDESKTIMASPDGLIKGQKKGLEIKCPKMETHIKYCLGGILPTEYKLQVMGNLWVSNYETWDFVSYCPEYTPQPLFLITVQRDETLIKAMDKQIRAFSKTLEAHKQTFRN